MLEVRRSRYQIPYGQRRTIAEGVRIVSRKVQDDRPVQSGRNRRFVHGQESEDLHATAIVQILYPSHH